ncbi:hypothetical protein BTR23_15895 [Alkalihalophilus pseudofirmus]|nr:hypothetical protein BTR23_15895 [Alkalihalophilus pseudofirmus]
MFKLCFECAYIKVGIIILYQVGILGWRCEIKLLLIKNSNKSFDKISISLLHLHKENNRSAVNGK